MPSQFKLLICLPSILVVFTYFLDSHGEGSVNLRRSMRFCLSPYSSNVPLLFDTHYMSDSSLRKLYRNLLTACEEVEKLAVASRYGADLLGSTCFLFSFRFLYCLLAEAAHVCILFIVVVLLTCIVKVTNE